MNLIRFLSEKGHQVRVVACDYNGGSKVDYYVLPKRNFGILTPILEKNGVVPAKADTKVLEEAIKDCDVLHTTLIFSVCRKAIRIAKKFNKPITSSFHCQAENISAHLGFMNINIASIVLYKAYYQTIYKYSDCIHYPTQFIEDVFEKAIKRKTNGYVISNGVNDVFQPKEVNKPEELKDKFVILSIGRLSAEKNHQLIVKAVGLSKYKEKIKIIIAGDGPLKGKVTKLAKKENVDLNISFFSREELVNLINYSDLYVHSAKVDLESIACLEALASGLVPVIMKSDKAAPKGFAIDDLSLSEYNNPVDMKNKIEFWIENKELKKEYSKKYAESMKKNNQTSCMEAMEQMLIDAIKNHKK